MGYKEELIEIQNELRKALKIYYETECIPFDETPEMELKKANRIYNKKLRALKEKYNIDDGSNTYKWEWIELFAVYFIKENREKKK